MTFPTYQVVFFIFSILLIFSATMVIVARNPVRAVLFLVLGFVAASVLWMLLQAEFLSLVLIFVYVGAVMTLFLFIVMMLHIDMSATREKFVRYLPIALLVMVVLVGLLIFALTPKHFAFAKLLPTMQAANYSNVKVMGELLYTHYLYAFEIASVILLVSIVSAIALAFHGRKSGTKSQKASEQLAARKADRLRIIKMKAEKP